MSTSARSLPVTAMIFTLNEEIHLTACLRALEWCDDVIVVDSFSTDRTEEICKKAGVRFYQQAFLGFGEQRNWALVNTSPRHPWVLILDADERVTPELRDEMGERLASCPEGIAAFRVKRRFHMWGRWLRYSSLYPTWVVRLIRVSRVRYLNRGHAETEAVDGDVASLAHDLVDENLKGIDEWFERQNRYSSKDAAYELSQRRASASGGLVGADPMRRRAGLKALASRIPLRGLVYFFYVYVLRGGFRDGRDGFMFCVMRAMYQTMVEVKKYDMKKSAERE